MSTNIIWDFDGVIADSELIWVENRRVLLNQTFNLNWDLNTAFEHLGGVSDLTKRLRLEEMGFKTDEVFWQNCLKMDYKSMADQKMVLTPHILEIIKENKNNQCIATGGVFDKTIDKINNLNIKDYFDKDAIFTADMVKYGKPEPDLFLLAQESMGWDKKDCVIVEDSFAGVAAGIKAGIKTIAFGAHVVGNKDYYIKEVKALGASDVFFDMREIKAFLNNL